MCRDQSESDILPVLESDDGRLAEMCSGDLSLSRHVLCCTEAVMAEIQLQAICVDAIGPNSRTCPVCHLYTHLTLFIADNTILNHF